MYCPVVTVKLHFVCIPLIYIRDLYDNSQYLFQTILESNSQLCTSVDYLQTPANPRRAPNTNSNNNSNSNNN